LYALYQAVEYVTSANVPGAFVECGVWRGGRSMMAALSFKENGDMTRQLCLYDTYTGMPKPSDKDVRYDGVPALQRWEEMEEAEFNKWCYAPLEAVKEAMFSTGYPKDKITFIKGKVEDTIPVEMPDQIAILRLDTDWYESVYHELVHLYPRLSIGGVLILDDYGHWQGAREAVQQYLSETKISLLLNRIDHTGRIAIKLPSLVDYQ